MLAGRQPSQSEVRPDQDQHRSEAPRCVEHRDRIRRDSMPFPNACQRCVPLGMWQFRVFLRGCSQPALGGCRFDVSKQGSWTSPVDQGRWLIVRSQTSARRRTAGSSVGRSRLQILPSASRVASVSRVVAHSSAVRGSVGTGTSIDRVTAFSTSTVRVTTRTSPCWSRLARRDSQALCRHDDEHHNGTRPRAGTSTCRPHHPHSTVWPGRRGSRRAVLPRAVLSSGMASTPIRANEFTSGPDA